MELSRPPARTPPPLRRMVKGWWTVYELNYAEAEAECLREAAALAGSTWASAISRQEELIEEARRNRVARLWEMRPPLTSTERTP